MESQSTARFAVVGWVLLPRMTKLRRRRSEPGSRLNPCEVAEPPVDVRNPFAGFLNACLSLDDDNDSIVDFAVKAYPRSTTDN